MSGYSPLKITGMATGLVQDRENFLLPDDAYPSLQNAYVWRERIKRKQGCELLGRLQRNLQDVAIGNSGASPWSFNIFTLAYITGEPNAQIVPGSVEVFFSPSTVSGTIGTPGYTRTSPIICQVFTSSTAGLFIGAQVTITGIITFPGTGDGSLNGGPYTVVLINTNVSFSISKIDSTKLGQWQSGGTWTAITGSAKIFLDQGNGNLVLSPNPLPNNFGTINYNTGAVVITYTGASGLAVAIDFEYYPNLPVMGIRTRELQNLNFSTSATYEQTVIFDQKYAYNFNNTLNNFQEFITGTTWNASGGSSTAANFFWSVNYWVSDAVNFPMSTAPVGTKLFWVTNNTGQFLAGSDPIRITDGSIWKNFGDANYNKIDATNYLWNALAILPFRGRLLMFNTWEGADTGHMQNFFNRIRWSTIGSPFIAYVNGSPNTGSWRSDIRGQGSFLDIPTSEDIISVGFVRDNLVIYCENSTWQLRYTGRAISPFQIERVNSELGAAGTFSTIQFDTSLVGIGDKGIVECDSYKSERIDIKIPEYVFRLQSLNSGSTRIQGIRDFQKRLAYWTLPVAASYDSMIAPSLQAFPNQRLVYNYENDSWATFDDSFTALGTFQTTSGRTWLNTKIPWKKCNFPWVYQPPSVAAIIGGNQQGFIEKLDTLTTNDVTLYVYAITANTTVATRITSPNHNLTTNTVIEISGIPPGTPFSTTLNSPTNGVITAIAQPSNPTQITSAGHNLMTGDVITISGVVGMTQLNGNTYTITVVDANTFTLNGIDNTTFTAYISGGIWTNTEINAFAIEVIDSNTFDLYVFNPATQEFDLAQIDTATGYVGGGLINVRDNFSITSKKFNFLDEGQNIQIGYLDILMDSTGVNNSGSISLNVYLDYDDVNASNTLPKNQINNGNIVPIPDTFFNTIINTYSSNLNHIEGTKFWQRVYCATRASFLTLQYTFSNAQMAGDEQELDVQIDAQVLWIRKAGRMSQG